MIRKLFDQVSSAVVLGLAIAVLAIHAFVIAGTWHLFGWRVGLFFGVCVFLLFEGMAVRALWEVLKYPLRKWIDEEPDEQEIHPLLRDSMDDPNIK